MFCGLWVNIDGKSIPLHRYIGLSETIIEGSSLLGLD